MASSDVIASYVRQYTVTFLDYDKKLITTVKVKSTITGANSYLDSNFTKSAEPDSDGYYIYSKN